LIESVEHGFTAACPEFENDATPVLGAISVPAKIPAVIGRAEKIAMMIPQHSGNRLRAITFPFKGNARRS
jgi:hypothetical protein